MKVLVLGGNGFIGSNLSKKLRDLGHSVISFYLNEPDIQCEGVTYIAGNFFDDNEIIPYLKGIDVVYHAISTINPGNSNLKYMQGYQLDFIQSVKLCDWAKKYNFRIIYLSSGGSVYGRQVIMPIEEERCSIPINHYGNLKLCVENTFRTFNCQFGTDIIIARIANPYGPGQDYSKGVGFIDAVLKRGLNKEVVEIWGDGSIIRDYIYIEDVCNMLGFLLDYQGVEKVFNISSGVGTSQNEILEIVRSLLPELSVSYLPARSVDVDDIILDNSKILSVFEEKILSVKKGIEKYYDFLLNEKEK